MYALVKNTPNLSRFGRPEGARGGWVRMARAHVAGGPGKATALSFSCAQSARPAVLPVTIAIFSPVHACDRAFGLKNPEASP